MVEPFAVILVFRIVKILLSIGFCLSLILPSGAQCGSSGAVILIENNENLQEISGCDTIWGSLTIHDWNASDLDLLSSLVYVEENLILEDNISLLDISGLSNLVEIGGNFELRNNFTLQFIDGLGSLENIGGDLIFEGNITLVNVDGLDLLTQIHGDLIFNENHTLTDVNGLNGVTSIGGDLAFNAENVILNDLQGLSNLEEIGGDLHCELPDATMLDGLENLNIVGGSVILENMVNVSNVNGLSGLATVQNHLQIRHNDNLIDVDALVALLEIGGNLEVHDNGSLFLCCGLKPVLQENIIGGEVIIENNGNGCSSELDIINLCIDDFVTEKHLEYLFISRSDGFTIQSNREIQARIFNILGNEIATLASSTSLTYVDSELVSGIYLILFRSGNISETRKYIKGK
jgi:hypothetical protein